MDQGKLEEGKDIRDEKDIIETKELFKFFKDNNLMRDSQKRFSDFEIFLNR